MPDDYATAAAVLAACTAAGLNEDDVFQTWERLYDRMRKRGADASAPAGSGSAGEDPLGGAES